MHKLKRFIKESKQEFAKVNWPTRAEAIRMVIIVIVISVIVAIFLGAVDLGFLFGLEQLLS